MLEIIRSLLIGFFAIAVLLPVVRFALRRLSPAQSRTTLNADELKYIQKKEWKLTLAYYIFSCILAVFAAGLMALISSILHNSNEHLHLLTPNFRAFFAPGLLFGLTLAIVPLRIAQGALLGHDYELYKQYMNQQEGHRSERGYAILFGVMLVLSVAVGWLAMRWHVVIDTGRISVTNFLGQEHIYFMRDIERIQSLGQEGEYIIWFSDTNNINTTYLKPVQPETIALLAQGSGKRIEY